MDTVRDGLAFASEKSFHWVMVWGGIVALGCLLEVGETWISLRSWFKKRRKQPIVEDDPGSWHKLVSAIGLVLVIVGIVGETVCEAFVSQDETAIRAYDESVLAQENYHLGQLLIEASYRSIPDPGWLTFNLRQFQGSKVILRSNSGDIESWLLCTELKKSIDAAGLLSTNECWQATDVRPFMGLEISGPNEHDTFAFAQTFVKAGIPGGITTSLSSPANSPFIILVSYKAPASFVQYPKPKSVESTSSTALSR